ncbi:hypothetical protein ACH4CE_36350 [Streptomyces gelaticus]|uniref:hypothetical protein n=1 Tax=Streptomyces gelaticus TaxID=285446 RepID=UPI00378AF824
MGLPVVVWAAGSAAYGHYSLLQTTQLAERHPVKTQLVPDAQLGGDLPTGAGPMM